jgi:hypothetical protein
MKQMESIQTSSITIFFKVDMYFSSVMVHIIVALLMQSVKLVTNVWVFPDISVTLVHFSQAIFWNYSKERTREPKLFIRT